ncbi:uncharacterized protein LOC128990592 isoform X1 [Macrosteles quadrilineatus]|uniref:uncharacterized protein LOC128990592 isoform X1 n=1 Tax=Macrosteles quadrilineatus TaxID=74068 RepID=UPI0023E25EAE|nr:uncharacterized protein LOC128990592 isoform X1 [Macrosteles quadrilineatus]
MAGTFLSILRSQKLLIRPGLISQGVLLGANVIGVSYFLKHSLLLTYTKKYTERVGIYGPDEPADELNNMMNDIITNDLKDKSSKDTPIALYLTSGMEPTHLGTVGTTSGGFVGVPVFYEFKNEEDVKENILIRDADKDTEVAGSKGTSNCFLLSNDAKKYGIAREILQVNTFLVYINGLVLPFGLSTILVLLYKEMNDTYKILKKPLYMRCLIYCVATLAGLSFWRYLYKNLLQYYESEVEASIAELGMDYIKGGIEHCTKELERNSLSFELNNVESSFYNHFEDLICSLLPIGIPVRTRLEYLKMLAEQTSNKSPK